MPTHPSTPFTLPRRSILLAGAAAGAAVLAPVRVAAAHSRQLTVTSRARLRAGAGVNTHFCLDPSVYTRYQVPNPTILQSLRDLDIGYIRERWWPGDPGQHAALMSLSMSKVGFFLFIGDMSYTPDRVRAEVAALAQAPFADSVVAVCGPNEANAAQDGAWPGRAVAIQQAIYEEVQRHPAFARQVKVVGPALKHVVADIDADFRALGAAGIIRWCDVGDFHFYPGNAGPRLNAAEARRAAQAFGPLRVFHSETGWTGSDTDPYTAGRFSVEALLRNHLTGIAGTVLYELADESPYKPGREGLFGLRTPTQPKPAYGRIRTLLATRDGGQRIDAWLGDYAQGVPCDAGAVVTSEGAGAWTVYLLRNNQPRATIFVVPRQGGTKRYDVQLTQSMTVVPIRT